MSCLLHRPLRLRCLAVRGSPLSDWLPLADCGGSAPLRPPFILFILHWINFTLAPPSIPSASPLPSPNPDSSFLLEIMSIMCLHLAWVLQELQYLSTYKRKIFPVHHHILFSPPLGGARRQLARLPAVFRLPIDLLILQLGRSFALNSEDVNGLTL